MNHSSEILRSKISQISQMTENYEFGGGGSGVRSNQTVETLKRPCTFSSHLCNPCNLWLRIRNFR
jgi:hypothetical protein